MFDCRNTKKRSLCAENCITCFNRSFASNPRSKYWSKKNGQTSPRQVCKGSHKKFWFDCDCGHEFESRLYNVTTNKSWCPFCANKKLCENNDCKNCLENSFESNPLSKYWSKKNGQTSPRQVFKSSGNKILV